MLSQGQARYIGLSILDWPAREGRWTWNAHLDP